MIEELDNPVWWALNSGNQTLAAGNARAKYFQPGISPFAGVAKNDAEHFQALKQLLTGDGTAAVFTTDKNLDPGPWVIARRIEGYQMMFEGDTPPVSPALSLTGLTEKHVPAMLELTRLSPPGPFMEETIRFGGYEGIFEDGQLMAMAGRRLHSGTYVEISAVCTRPGHSGKGYARNLIYSQINQIRAEGNIPYLHVRADNTRAIRIYQNMGFVTRTEMIIYVLKK